MGRPHGREVSHRLVIHQPIVGWDRIPDKAITFMWVGIPANLTCHTGSINTNTSTNN